MHKINPENEDICWRCRVTKSTLSHICYFCLGVQTFWNKIYKIYPAKTGINLQPNILVSVLSVIPGSVKNIKKDILKYFLTAARTTIARKWKNRTAPSIDEWMSEMSEMRSMEERMMIEKGLKKTNSGSMGSVGRV